MCDAPQKVRRTVDYLSGAANLAYGASPFPKIPLAN